MAFAGFERWLLHGRVQWVMGEAFPGLIPTFYEKGIQRLSRGFIWLKCPPERPVKGRERGEFIISFSFLVRERNRLKRIK